MIDNNNDLQVLEAFVVDNRELEKFESLLVQFKIFKDLRAVLAELCHSNFLAFQ